MNELEMDSMAGVTSGLSQWQRVANIFSAPSKTFEDIKRGNRSWWLPFLIAVLFGYLLFGVVNTKVGMRQVVENQIHLNPQAEEQMAQAPPERRESSLKVWLYITEGMFLGSPVMLLFYDVVISAVLLGTINFAFGGKARFADCFALWFFAGLPGIVKVLLGIVVLLAGAAPESFNIQNFAPTNLGAFLNPAETNKALYALASALDVVTIWTLILLGMGTAIVAGVKRSSGYIAVFGWWAVIVGVGVIAAALRG